MGWPPFDQQSRGDKVVRTATLLAISILVACAAPAGSADGDAPKEVPAPSTAPVPQGDYVIDKAHTSLMFRVSHLGFSAYTGRFTRVEAELQFDPANITASRVNVRIDPRSIEADNAPSGFLQALAGSEWLDAGRFPELNFRSQSVEPTGANRFRIHGQLTLHGVTRPVVLDAKYNGGYAGHTYEPQARVGFSAQGTLRRSEFGITYGLPDPGSSFGVGDEITVILESEFTGPPLSTR
jgi:polyisoprenoid-binding protein YceI